MLFRFAQKYGSAHFQILFFRKFPYVLRSMVFSLSSDFFTSLRSRPYTSCTVFERREKHPSSSLILHSALTVERVLIENVKKSTYMNMWEKERIDKERILMTDSIEHDCPYRNDCRWRIRGRTNVCIFWIIVPFSWIISELYPRECEWIPWYENESTIKENKDEYRAKKYENRSQHSEKLLTQNLITSIIEYEIDRSECVHYIPYVREKANYDEKKQDISLCNRIPSHRKTLFIHIPYEREKEGHEK